MSRTAIALVAATVCAGLLSATSAAAERTSTAGAPAPDFAVHTIDGKPFRLSAQRHRVVVVDFLLPGCGECELESPALDQAARRFAGLGVSVLIFDMAGVDDRLLRSYYLSQLGLRSVLVANDAGLRVARRYGVSAVGTTVIIGRDGRVRWRGSWLGKRSELFGQIASALR